MPRTVWNRERGERGLEFIFVVSLGLGTRDHMPPKLALSHLGLHAGGALGPGRRYPAL